jgi:hypothetical protein
VREMSRRDFLWACRGPWRVAKQISSNPGADFANPSVNVIYRGRNNAK